MFDSTSLFLSLVTGMTAFVGVGAAIAVALWIAVREGW